MSEHICLYEFDLNEIKQYSNILIVGEIGTGKTTLIAKIMKAKSNSSINEAIIFEHIKELPEELFGSNLSIISEIVDVNNVLDRIAMMESIDKLRGIKEKTGAKNGHWLIIDDVLDYKKFRNSTIEEIICHGRHFNIWPIFCFGYNKIGNYGVKYPYSMIQRYANIESFPPQIPPNIRCNLDFIFLSGEEDKEIINHHYRQYGHMFNKYEDFENIFIFLTSKHRWLIINNTVRSKNPYDFIFYL